MKIYQQIPKVMAEIEAIGKDRKNESQGFKFRGIDDIYNELHSNLAKHGVFTVPEVLESHREERQTKTGGVMTYTISRIKYRFFADDGSCVEAVVIGEGSDTGDKSSNKSMAVAHKYAFLQVFAIPTEDDKDPDSKSHELAPTQAVKPIAPVVKPKAEVFNVDPVITDRKYAEIVNKVKDLGLSQDEVSSALKKFNVSNGKELKVSQLLAFRDELERLADAQLNQGMNDANEDYKPSS